MSDFKDKLKMFETSNPPPLKAKPLRQASDSPGKVPDAKVPRTDHLVSTSSALTSEEAEVTPAKHNDDIDRFKEMSPGEDFSDFETFYFCNSVYDLPGLELFVLEPVATETARERSLSVARANSLVAEATQSESDTDRLHPIEDIQLSPSPALIEEIFNTGIWRNSNNFSDDFIFAPPKISVPSNHSEDLLLSETPPTAISDQKKAQPQGRRSIFNSIFRSKRKPKKSIEKLSGKDNSDSDSLQDSPIKGKQTGKSLPEADSGSLDAGPVKPLNSMFNRDWLNTIGDGIKKKASVMSELKKVFTHGKFKHFKKKNPKNGSVASSEKTNLPTKVANLDDSIYDSDVEMEEVCQAPSGSLHGQEKKLSKKSASSNCPKNTLAPSSTEDLKDLPMKQKETLTKNVMEEDADSIYDEDAEEEISSKNSKWSGGVSIKPSPSRMSDHPFGSHVDEIYVQDEDDRVPLTTPGFQSGGPQARPTSGTDSIYDEGSDDDEGSDNGEVVVVKKAPPKEPSGKSMLKTWGNLFRGGISKDAPHDQMDILKTNQSAKNSSKVNFSKSISPKKNEKEKDAYDDEEVMEEYADDLQADVSSVVIMAATKVPKSLSKVAPQVRKPSGKGVLLPSMASTDCTKEFLENDEYDADADDIEVYASDDEEEEVGRDDLSEITREGMCSKEERTMEIYSDNDEQVEEYFSDVDDDVDAEKETPTATQKKKEANVVILVNSRETEQYDQDYDDDGPDVQKVNKDLPPMKAPGSENTTSQKKPVFKDKSKKNKPFFRFGKKGSELYDEDIDDEDIEEYVSDGSVDGPEVEIPQNEDKFARDPKVEGGKVLKTKGGKKLFYSNFFMANQTEKEVGPSGMTVHRTIKGMSTEVYDDDYDDSLMSEEVLTVAKKAKVKVENIKRRAAETRETKDKKQRENTAVDRKKVEMSLKPPRKTPSSQDVEEEPKKRDARLPIRSDEYDKDEEESFSLSKSIKEASVEVFSFNTEDDALKKVIKKNLNAAKKTFKLKEPFRPIATARAIKTVYSEGKLHMKFNVGEILEVLEYRDELILVRNGVGKCGLTARSNIQLLKRNA